MAEYYTLVKKLFTMDAALRSEINTVNYVSTPVVLAAVLKPERFCAHSEQREHASHWIMCTLQIQADPKAAHRGWVPEF